MSTEWSESPRGTASRMKGPRSISLQLKANWPVSIWVMSRVSLARRARCSVSLITVRMNSWRVSMGRSGSSRTSSAKPRMAMSGRRKSWATMPTNSLFRRSNSSKARVGPLQLVVEVHVLHGHRGLRGHGQEQVQVLVGERGARAAVGHHEQALELGAPGHGGDHHRLQAQLGHEVAQEAGVGLGLVGQ